MNHRAIGVLSHRYSEDYPEVEALVVAHRAGVHMAETHRRNFQYRLV